VLFNEPSRTAYDLHFAIAGVPVRVHPFFWLITLLMGASGNPEPVDVLIWVAAVFVSIVVHEFGHALAYRFFGWTCHIVLYSFGGLAIGDSIGRRGTRPQIAISAAGPLAGFAFAAVLVTGLRLSGRTVSLHFGLPLGIQTALPFFKPAELHTFLDDLLYVNIFWGLVNLLPIYPLDGGRISREILSFFNPRDGLRQSILVSIFAAAGMAFFAWERLDSQYTALFFGYLAYTSYTMLQAFSGGGPGRPGW
jgi:stage IV sporulation protein FB